MLLNLFRQSSWLSSTVPSVASYRRRLERLEQVNWSSWTAKQAHRLSTFRSGIAVFLATTALLVVASIGLSYSSLPGIPGGDTVATSLSIATILTDLLALLLAVLIFASEATASRLGEFAFLNRHLGGRRGVLPVAAFAFGVAAANAIVVLWASPFAPCAVDAILWIDAPVLFLIITFGVVQVYQHAFVAGDDVDQASLRSHVDELRRGRDAAATWAYSANICLRRELDELGLAATALRPGARDRGDSAYRSLSIDLPVLKRLGDVDRAGLRYLTAVLEEGFPASRFSLDLQIGSSTAHCRLLIQTAGTGSTSESRVLTRLTEILRSMLREARSDNAGDFGRLVDRIHEALLQALSRHSPAQLRPWMNLAEVAYQPVAVPPEFVGATGTERVVVAAAAFDGRQMCELVRAVCETRNSDSMIELMYWCRDQAIRGDHCGGSRRYDALAAISLLFRLSNSAAPTARSEVGRHVDNALHRLSHEFLRGPDETDVPLRQDVIALLVLHIELIQVAIEQQRDRSIDHFFYRLGEIARGWFASGQSLSPHAHLGIVASVAVVGWCFQLAANPEPDLAPGLWESIRRAVKHAVSLVGSRESLFTAFRRASEDELHGAGLGAELRLDRLSRLDEDWQYARPRSYPSADSILQDGFLLVGCLTVGQPERESHALNPLAESIRLDQMHSDLASRSPAVLTVLTIDPEADPAGFEAWILRAQLDRASAFARTAFIGELDPQKVHEFQRQLAERIRQQRPFGIQLVSGTAAIGCNPVVVRLRGQAPRQLFASGPAEHYLGLEQWYAQEVAQRQTAIVVELLLQEALPIELPDPTRLRDVVAESVRTAAQNGKSVAVVCEWRVVRSIAELEHAPSAVTGWIGATPVYGLDQGAFPDPVILVLELEQQLAPVSANADQQPTTILQVDDVEIEVRTRQLDELLATEDLEAIKRATSYRTDFTVEHVTGFSFAGRGRRFRIPVPASEDAEFGD